MDYVLFGEGAITTISTHRRVTAGVYTVALLFHAVLLVTLFVIGRPHPVRIGPTGSTQIGIAAYNPGPIGTVGATPTPAPKPAAPKKTSTTKTAGATSLSGEQSSEPADSGGAGAQGAGSGSGPVRLGSGEGLTLLTKITPVYPRMMESARIPGTVVLEAIIHRDGTIGDVTVQKSTNSAFAQAAVEAVKQWRYSPLPYEGLVTVTVNFTLPR
jgi:TonB family protein